MEKNQQQISQIEIDFLSRGKRLITNKAIKIKIAD